MDLWNLVPCFFFGKYPLKTILLILPKLDLKILFLFLSIIILQNRPIKLIHHNLEILKILDFGPPWNPPKTTPIYNWLGDLESSFLILFGVCGDCSRRGKWQGAAVSTLLNALNGGALEGLHCSTRKGRNRSTLSFSPSGTGPAVSMLHIGEPKNPVRRSRTGFDKEILQPPNLPDPPSRLQKARNTPHSGLKKKYFLICFFNFGYFIA